MKNEFIDPDNYPFEVLGYFEEFVDATTKKVLGTRRLETLDRPLGSDGMTEFDLVETLTLNKGHKQHVVKASPQRPLRVITMVQVLCGAAKEKQNKK